MDTTVGCRSGRTSSSATRWRMTTCSSARSEGCWRCAPGSALAVLAACGSSPTPATAATLVGDRLVPDLDLGGQRHGADQGTPPCHRVAVTDGDRDALRHRGREPGEGRRQVLRLSPGSTPNRISTSCSRTSRPSSRTDPTSWSCRATAPGSRAGSRRSASRCCPFHRPRRSLTPMRSTTSSDEATGHVQAAEAEAAHVKAQIAADRARSTHGPPWARPTTTSSNRRTTR